MNFISGPLLLNKLNSEPCSRNAVYKYLLLFFKQSFISLPVCGLQNERTQITGTMEVRFILKYIFTGETTVLEGVTPTVPDGTV